jgi:hypothetical protein
LSSGEQLLIHGGLHKTGSTFVQNTFLENRAALLTEGVLYPETGLSRDTQVGRRHSGLLKSLQMEGPSSVAWQRLREEIETAKVERCVLSRENFPAVVPPHLIRQLAPNADIHLTVCIRHPVDYLESRYREWVQRIGYSGTPAQFYSVTAKHMEWEHSLTSWADVLGEDRVHVISLDHIRREDLAKIVLTSAFADLSHLALEPTAHDNRSISNGECLLLLTANRLRHAVPTLPKNRSLANLPVPYRGTEGRLFSDDIVDDVMEKFGDSYERLLVRAGVSDAGVYGKWISRSYDMEFSARENAVRCAELLALSKDSVTDVPAEIAEMGIDTLVRKVMQQRSKIAKLTERYVKSKEKITALKGRSKRKKSD